MVCGILGSVCQPSRSSSKGQNRVAVVFPASLASRVPLSWTALPLILFDCLRRWENTHPLWNQYEERDCTRTEPRGSSSRVDLPIRYRVSARASLQHYGLERSHRPPACPEEGRSSEIGSEPGCQYCDLSVLIRPWTNRALNKASSCSTQVE